MLNERSHQNAHPIRTPAARELCVASGGGTAGESAQGAQARRAAVKRTRRSGGRRRRRLCRERSVQVQGGSASSFVRRRKLRARVWAGAA